MQIALDKDNNRVHISQACGKNSYFCPCCGSSVLQRRGKVNAHHFAHFKDSICKDTWHYDMTEWHQEWQNRFPKEYQEIVKTKDNQIHRADVLIEDKKIVFEFQHSPLSSDEFEDRNLFYNSLGYKVIWIFDVEEQYKNEAITNNSSDAWNWKRPKRTFAFFNYKNKQVELYLQLNNEKIDLIKVTWCSEDKGLSFFATDGYFYDDVAIVNTINCKNNSKTEYYLADLSDKLIKLYSKSHTTYFFGCPISSTHICGTTNIDIPDEKYSEIMPCSSCKYFILRSEYSDHSLICKKRFLDLGLRGNTRVCIEKKDSNGFISQLSYYNNDQKVLVDLPVFNQVISKDILTLWEENNCSIATFRNIKTGIYVRIYEDPNQQYYRKNKKVEGKISYNKFSFSGNNREIFGFNDPVWVLEWHETTDNSKARIEKSANNGFESLTNLYTFLNAVRENHIIMYDCLNEQYYWIEIVDKKSKRFNAYLYNLQSKTKSSVASNEDVLKKATKNIWSIYFE